MHPEPLCSVCISVWSLWWFQTKAKEKPYANIQIRFSTSSLSQSKFSLFYLSLQHNVSPFLTRYIDIDFAFAPSWNYLDAFWCVLVRGPAVSCRLCICSILQNPPLLSPLTPWNLQSHAAVLHCQLWHHLVFYAVYIFVKLRSGPGQVSDTILFFKSICHPHFWFCLLGFKGVETSQMDSGTVGMTQKFSGGLWLKKLYLKSYFKSSELDTNASQACEPYYWMRRVKR